MEGAEAEAGPGHSVPPPWWAGQGTTIEPSNVADLEVPHRAAQGTEVAPSLQAAWPSAPRAGHGRAICPKLTGSQVLRPGVPSFHHPQPLHPLMSTKHLFTEPLLCASSQAKHFTHLPHLILTMPDATGARRVKQLV